MATTELVRCFVYYTGLAPEMSMVELSNEARGLQTTETIYQTTDTFAWDGWGSYSRDHPTICGKTMQYSGLSKGGSVHAGLPILARFMRWAQRVR